MSTSTAQAEETIIRVSGIQTGRGGNITVLIFGKKGFPIKHEAALHTQSAKARKAVMEFRFSLELKEMAVKVHHDQDENGKVTKNWTGLIPAEGLGFSKDQRIGRIRPPSYNNSKLIKKQYLSGVNITIRYPSGK